jgi:hypothetical protein
MVGKVLRVGSPLRVLLVMGLAVLVSCAGMQPPPPTPDSNTLVKLPASSGGLLVSSPDVQTDGRLAKIRGRVTNQNTEPVEGIRYLVRLQTRDEVPRTLDSFQFDTNEKLPAGESAMMRLDVESMYFSTASEVSIEAVPKKLGGQTVPLPTGWK